MDSVPMGTVISGDPLCQLRTSSDPCAPSLFPGPCCSSIFSPSLDICSSIPSPCPCPSFLTQLARDSQPSPQAEAFLLRFLLIFSFECSLPFSSDPCIEHYPKNSCLQFLSSSQFLALYQLVFIPSLSPPHPLPFSRSSPSCFLSASCRSSQS